ncbi:hypothetical protein ACFQAT_28865 [Undibacterium arcticum]|uniref:hypothetical protein n=1 Tax=Undibacterium arcticum TaxID=1762892 RepID=UPI00361B2EA6
MAIHDIYHKDKFARGCFNDATNEVTILRGSILNIDLAVTPPSNIAANYRDVGKRIAAGDIRVRTDDRLEVVHDICGLSPSGARVADGKTGSGWKVWHLVDGGKLLDTLRINQPPVEEHPLTIVKELAKPRQGSVANTLANPTDRSGAPPPGNTGTLTAGQDRSECGYRIAHAQKSLSLVLKHMWCHGFLTNPPPVCVIDSIILRAAAGRGAATHRVPWTRVASLKAYREHLAICKCAAGGHQIAIWELFVFYGGEPPGDLTNEQLQHAKESFLLKNPFAAPPGSYRSRAIHDSLKDVHRSAFGRNPTWRVGERTLARAPVRRRHDQLLIEIYSHYESGVRHTEEHFIEDIAHLVAVMNSEFEKYFR